MQTPKPGEFYYHFKKKLYQVLAVAEHTENGETLVIYQALYGDFRVYARPLSMFVSPVDREKYPDAEQEYRFEHVKLSTDAARERTFAEASSLQIGETRAAAEPPRSEQAASQEESKKPEQEAAQAEPQTQEAAAAEASQEAAEAETPMSPWLETFLDAVGYEKQLEVLTQMTGQVGQREISSIAVALDLKETEGSPEEQLNNIRRCLLTRKKFDGTRLR